VRCDAPIAVKDDRCPADLSPIYLPPKDSGKIRAREFRNSDANGGHMYRRQVLKRTAVWVGVAASPTLAVVAYCCRTSPVTVDTDGDSWMILNPFGNVLAAVNKSTRTLTLWDLSKVKKVAAYTGLPDAEPPLAQPFQGRRLFM
jgi:hypothetical protein